jgi:hypothetical protein
MAPCPALLPFYICSWEARIGRGAGGRPAAGGRKYTYLGLYDSEIEAAMAYDRAAVRLKGLAAITNFDLSSYLEELNPGMPSFRLT